MSAGEIKTCSQCGAPIDSRASSCKFCGAEFARQPVAAPQAYRPPPPPPKAGPYSGAYTPPPQQGPYGGPYPPQQRPYYPPPAQPVYNSGKSKVVAGILGFFLVAWVYISFIWAMLVQGLFICCSAGRVYRRSSVLLKGSYTYVPMIGNLKPNMSGTINTNMKAFDVYRKAFELV